MNRYSIDDIVNRSTGISAEGMEQLADFAGVGFFNIDLATGDIRLNRNTALLTGYELGDLPHTSDTKSMLTFEEDRELVDACMQSLLSGEQDRYQLEYRMRRRDGSIVSVRESAMVAERDKAGRPTRIIGMAHDLSRLKWAEEKSRALEQENRRLAKGIPEGDLMRQNHMLRAANDAAAMIIGGFHQDYETVLRQSLQILGESIEADRTYLWRNRTIDGELCCFERAEWARVKQSSVISHTKPIPYSSFLSNWEEYVKDHQNLRALTRELEEGVKDFPSMQDVRAVMLIPLFLQGEFWGFVGFDECTNERVFTEDEAEIMQAGALVIASSVSRNESFAKLNEAREAAMASTRAKSEFLSRMSHEIRTPMNAIIGMTTIAKRTDDPDKIRYCLDKVDASSRQLLGIINDVLDMSKIDANKLEINNAPFDFEKMTQSVLNVVQVKLEEKHQDFHFDFDHVFTRQMVSDELRLSQVLINLLSNAIKFTPEGGNVTMKVRQQNKDEDTSVLHVEVVDTGIGIDPDKRDKLFDSFEQADGSITRQYGGTGLGLSICKKIINLMGGEIWIESAAGGGSRFIFEIEVGWADKLMVTDRVASMPSSLRVLVVDDGEDVLEYFTNILSSFSLLCDTASSGEAAVEMVQASIKNNRPYDMVFIDWNMPGMNGGATAEKIRQLAGDEIITVMISVSEWSDIEKEAKSSGVSNFLTKPVLPSVLYDTIVSLTDNNLIRQKSEDAGEVEIHWEDKQILLAEDIEINREIVASILEDTGVQITFAEDGQKAVDAFEAQPDRFDLVLMDMQMPNVDGLEATRRIRNSRQAQAKTIPIVAMTANAFKEDEEMCMEAGMNGHLAKPLNVDDLFKALHRYLG